MVNGIPLLAGQNKPATRHGSPSQIPGVQNSRTGLPKVTLTSNDDSL
jgi:hypothetical protein